MPKDHVGALAVLVGAAYTRVGDFNEHLVACGLVVAGFGLDNATAGRTLEYGEFKAHSGDSVRREDTTRSDRRLGTLAVF